MKTERSCGVLMHITSLPGKYGIGTMGKEAYEFADFLRRSGQSYWQILPTGPVCEPEFSPYESTSTFAGNPLFINTDLFSEKSWVAADVLAVHEFFPPSHAADYPRAEQRMMEKMKAIFALFLESAPKSEKEAFTKFCKANASWLDDYALFAALSGYFGTIEWIKWEHDIRLRKAAAMERWSKDLAPQIEFQKYLQFVFNDQWHRLKKYCNDIGLKIVGDIPIYVSFNSADAWANPEVFDLDDETGIPREVAGVPPDYFSPTGQRWGNPLYRWTGADGKLSEPMIRWWAARIRQVHSFVDIIRIDHFRAFNDYWAIPADAPNAMTGQWKPGPGMPFFDRIKKELGELPFIAEDLGNLTPEVEQLRDQTGFPGMKILQFAFDGDPNNAYLPFNFTTTNCIVYTGTHDNDTTNSWYYASGLDDTAKRRIREYMGFGDDHEFHLKLIQYAYATVAKIVIIPAQDILGYGPGFRMNTPGVHVGNWVWMLTPGALGDLDSGRLYWWAQQYNRLPKKK